jgi:hypothetical protein
MARDYLLRVVAEVLDLVARQVEHRPEILE